MRGKRPKRILDRATIIKIEEPMNTRTKTHTLGEIELKFVSLNDSVQIMGLLEKIKQGRDFTARVLHHQLMKPKISLKKLLELPDKELRKLGRDFLASVHPESPIFRGRDV
jgi:hypothetical protein